MLPLLPYREGAILLKKKVCKKKLPRHRLSNRPLAEAAKDEQTQTSCSEDRKKHERQDKERP